MPRLVLVGGGHAHVLVLEALREVEALPVDWQVVLISDSEQSYYSGMLPGCIAQLYTPAELSINVASYARRCAATFVLGRMVGLDRASRTVLLEDGTVQPYELVSLDVGSTVRLAPGVAEHALATRPIQRLLDSFDRFVTARPWLREDADTSALRLLVVGGGAAGVELAFAARERLLALAAEVQRTVHTTLVTSDAHVLEAAGESAVRLLANLLAQRDIVTLCGRRVHAVREHAALLDDGSQVAFDLCIWATGAAAHDVLAFTQCQLDARGFVLVNNKLQSVSDPQIFGAGDCVSLDEHPHVPKAGVYAVREAPILAANLLSAMRAWPDVAAAQLRSYEPQQGFLSLLALGDGTAVGLWKGLASSGSWLWKLKDRIDRKFMGKFDAPDPSSNSTSSSCSLS